VRDSGRRYGKVKLVFHFQDLHKITYEALISSTTPNPVDGLYRSIKDFLQLLWWQSF